MVNGELPGDWKISTLGKEFKWGSGGTPLRSKSEYYGGNIPWVIIGDLNDNVISETAENITEQGLNNSSAKWVEEGSVLIAMYGSIGKLGIAGKRLTTNQAIAFTKPESVSSKYLFYYLMGERNNLLSLGSGATQQNISQTVIKAYPFPIAPKDEQERIVAKIEELFTQLEAGTSALERVQAALRRYKASMLKAGMNGTLLGNGKNDGAFPEGWQNVQLVDVLSESLTNGKSTPNAENGFPVLRLTALKDGRIDLRERKIGAWTKEQAKNYLVKRGDFFVSRGNGSLHLVGRGGLVEQEPDDVAYPDTLIRIRVSPTDCDINYLRTIWNSNFIRNQIETTARTTAGIYKINQKDLESFTFPLPPLEEQRRIVAEVERRLSVAREVETVVEKALARSTRLRQAVLKSAFEGKL